jgi:tripartite-type tricarboxylate transporter receptor subunit TctC
MNGFYDRRKVIRGMGAGAVALTLTPGAGWAQSWPRRPITLVIGYSEGGGTDTIIRAIGRALEKHLKVNIRAVNQPGAAGALAAEAVLGKGNDGYWMFGAADYNKIYRVQGYSKKAPWLEWQFLKVGRSVPAWAVAPDSQFKTLADVVEAARASPGTIRISNAGVGSIWHEATLVALERGTGAKFSHVPYTGGAPAALAVLQGEVDVVGSGVHEQVEYLRTGKLRNLGVFRREPLVVAGVAEPLPPVTASIPGAADLGLIQGVYAVAIRRDTPKEILTVVQDAVKAAVDDPDFKSVLENRVMYPEFKTGEEVDREAALFEAVTSWLFFEQKMQGVKHNPQDLGIPRPEEFEKWWPPEGYKPVL